MEEELWEYDVDVEFDVGAVLGDGDAPASATPPAAAVVVVKEEASEEGPASKQGLPSFGSSFDLKVSIRGCAWLPPQPPPHFKSAACARL
jgi:hypothetical protein